MKSRTFGYLIFVIIMLSLSMLLGPILFPVEEPATRKETRSEFTSTLVAAYQKLKKGETITGREYLALNEMVREHARVQKTNPSPNEDNTQLEKLCVLMQIDPQELIALVMDTEGVTVQRTSPWDGNSTHHL